MAEKPIVSFKAVNGKISLYKTYVRIDRGTIIGFMSQGLKGTKDIFIKNITSVQIKKPGVTMGHLQFSLPGGNESTKGHFDMWKDENSIVFKGEHYELALKIKDYIESKFTSTDASQTPQASTSSVADELRKLSALKKEGAIDASEFKELKKKLISGKS